MASVHVSSDQVHCSGVIGTWAPDLLTYSSWCPAVLLGADTSAFWGSISDVSSSAFMSVPSGPGCCCAAFTRSMTAFWYGLPRHSSTGVRQCLLRAEALAPLASSNLMTPWHPLRQAQCRGVLPSEFDASRFAPESIRALAASSWPLADAMWRAVLPMLSAESTSALLSRANWMSSMSPYLAPSMSSSACSSGVFCC